MCYLLRSRVQYRVVLISIYVTFLAIEIHLKTGQGKVSYKTSFTKLLKG